MNESEKVRQSDRDHPAKAGQRDSVWDGHTIRIFGCRNETVGFQFILESADLGATGVDVEMDSLVNGDCVIRNDPVSAEPFDFRGRRIELFMQSYLAVQTRSDWWLASARPLPDDLHTGMIPDALVPFEVRGTFANGCGSVPFSIGPQQNQGVWVDVYIPLDAVPGVYHGAIVVTEDTVQTFTIPVALRVYDFTLSDTTHLNNHFFWGWTTAAARHGVENGSPQYWALFHSYAKFFHRHRLDLIDGSRSLQEFKSHLAGYYTGERYTAAAGYDGPGVGVGQQTYSIGTYDQPADGWRSGFSPDTPGAWQKASDAWEQWFRDHAPTVLRYKYLEDEPPYAHWPDVRKRGLWIREGKGVGRYLGTHVTTRMGEELYGAITMWMTGGHAGWRDSGGTTGYDIPVAKTRRAVGEKVGFYNGQRPSYGDPVALDNFATDARVNPWIAWKYRADQYFLWETAFYASGNRNAWKEVVEGSLIYTGVDRKFPRDSRGLEGPIASLRMKNLRRGFQDYEYLWLARLAGIDTRAIVDRVVPAAFNDYNGSTFTTQADQPIWADRGEVYEIARRELAGQIETAVKQGRLQNQVTTRVKAK